MSIYTRDQVAQAIIAEGQKRGVTPRGIQIAIATGLVESNLTVYANSKVPASLAIPHDAVGCDGMSVGVFQQQVIMGASGWWWGDAATCMDPTLSAGLFYSRLCRLDYNGPNSPGSYAQAVQQSAFPDRYDQRMADAVASYDRLSGAPAVPVVAPPVFSEDNQIGRYANFSSRNGTKVDLLIIHTEEPYGTDCVPAQHLADFIKDSEGTSNPVSYHYAVGQRSDGAVEVIDIVDTDYECWAVLDSNPNSINYCFAGSAVAMTTQEWMDRYGNAIDVVAYLVVADARKYNVPLNVLVPPYPADPPGVTDHRYVTDHLGDGSHTDVGDNFPWPYFMDRINHYGNGTSAATSTPASTTADAGAVLTALTPAQQQEIYDIVTKKGQSRSFLATDGALIENMLGFEYNVDGNVWNMTVTWAYLFDVPSAVAIVEQVASGGPVSGSWAAASPAVTEFGIAYCKGLVAFKPKLLALLNKTGPPPKSSANGTTGNAAKTSVKSAANGAASQAVPASADPAAMPAPAGAVN
jgi:N-acetylmuramoyl-L-alanine amidase-like protein